MILLSRREAFTSLVSRILERPPLGTLGASGPFCCATWLEAERHQPTNRDCMLAVDLGSPEYHGYLVEFLGGWRERWPASGLVLASPGVWPAEAGLVARLGQGAEVLCRPALYEPEAWHRVVAAGVAGPLVGAIWADLCSIACDLGRPIPYERQVMAILEASPQVREVSRYTRRPEGQPERRSLPSRVRRAFDARTRTLIYGLRLLWAVRLRQEGWSPWDVSRFLSYEDSSHAARKLRQFWRIGMRDLDRVPYRSVAEALVEWMTASRGPLARLNRLQDLRSRIARLPVQLSTMPAPSSLSPEHGA